MRAAAAVGVWTGRPAAHVAERAGGAGRGAGGGRPGTASPHRHAARTPPRADTTPAPEERHCALSQPSLNEHSARHPPLGTNSIREHCCYDGRRQPSAAILSLLSAVSALHRLAACFKVVLITSRTGDTHAR